MACSLLFLVTIFTISQSIATNKSVLFEPTSYLPISSNGVTFSALKPADIYQYSQYWRILAGDDIGFHLQLSLDNTWSFHPSYITNIQIEIGTFAFRSEFLLSFSQLNDSYISTMIDGVFPYEHLAYPQCVISPYKSGIAHGNILQNVQASNGKSREQNVLNNTKYYMLPHMPSTQTLSPFTFTLQNNPWNNILSLTFSDTITVRTCNYEAMNVNLPLDIYLSTNIYQSFYIESLAISYWIDPQTPSPSIEPTKAITMTPMTPNTLKPTIKPTTTSPNHSAVPSTAESAYQPTTAIPSHSATNYISTTIQTNSTHNISTTDIAIQHTSIIESTEANIDDIETGNKSKHVQILGLITVDIDFIKLYKFIGLGILCGCCTLCAVLICIIRYKRKRRRKAPKNHKLTVHELFPKTPIHELFASKPAKVPNSMYPVPSYTGHCDMKELPFCISCKLPLEKGQKRRPCKQSHDDEEEPLDVNDHDHEVNDDDKQNVDGVEQERFTLSSIHVYRLQHGLLSGANITNQMEDEQGAMMMNMSQNNLEIENKGNDENELTVSSANLYKLPDRFPSADSPDVEMMDMITDDEMDVHDSEEKAECVDDAEDAKLTYMRDRRGEERQSKMESELSVSIMYKAGTILMTDCDDDDDDEKEEMGNCVDVEDLDL